MKKNLILIFLKKMCIDYYSTKEDFKIFHPGINLMSNRIILYLNYD